MKGHNTVVKLKMIQSHIENSNAILVMMYLLTKTIVRRLTDSWKNNYSYYKLNIQQSVGKLQCQ